MFLPAWEETMQSGATTVGFLHPGYWQACFANSLLDLMFYDMAHEQRVVGHRFGHMGKETGAAHIHAGRNRIAAAVLDESESEWLWFIDSDMGFAPDAIDTLIESADPVERPVMGGLAFAQKSDGSGPFYARRYRATPTVYKATETEDDLGFVPMFDYPENAVIEVAATGAACLLIHRSALQAIRDSHGDTWFDYISLPTPSGTRREFGEDMSFCLRLMAEDIPIHVNTAVKTTHDKGAVFLDEDTYRLQQAMLTASEAD